MPSEDSPFNCFKFFRNFLAKRREERAKKRNRKATDAELQSVLKFIGGFEKWELLNEDCRQEVVKNLNYKSRYNLGLCSKSNYATVEATPYSVYYLSISDTYPENTVTVRIKFNIDSDKDIKLVFSQIEQDTKISWDQRLSEDREVKRQIIWKSTNYYEEAVKFAENWMKKCNYELQYFDINMSSYPFKSSATRKFPKCKAVEITADDGETIKWWLKRVPEQLEYCCLNSSEEVLQEFCEYPQIQQATEMVICETSFSDEQLLKLSAKRIEIHAHLITVKGINQFLKKLINNGIPGFRETIFRGEYKTSRDEEKLTNGIRFREWKDDFEVEEKAFCDEYKAIYGDGGNQYQIESLVVPSDSFTLCVRNERVSVYRADRDGWGSVCGFRRSYINSLIAKRIAQN